MWIFANVAENDRKAFLWQKKKNQVSKFATNNGWQLLLSYIIQKWHSLFRMTCLRSCGPKSIWQVEGSEHQNICVSIAQSRLTEIPQFCGIMLSCSSDGRQRLNLHVKTSLWKREVLFLGMFRDFRSCFVF